MRFGVNTFIWGAAFGPPLFGLLPRIKEAGFDGIEFPILDPQAFEAVTAIARPSATSEPVSTSSRESRPRAAHQRAAVPSAAHSRNSETCASSVQNVAEMPWRASVNSTATSAAIRITASTLRARQKSGR